MLLKGRMTSQTSQTEWNELLYELTREMVKRRCDGGRFAMDEEEEEEEEEYVDELIPIEVTPPLSEDMDSVMEIQDIETEELELYLFDVVHGEQDIN